jgi:hypothetical protein
MFDPNSTIHSTREVRYTARVSVLAPFVAPDIAPVSLLARELEKGTKGWTATDIKLPAVVNEHRPVGWEERELAEFTAGQTVARRERSHRAVARPSKRRWK